MKKRIQLGVIISRAMKKQIAELARTTGMSQGQIAEQLMLQALGVQCPRCGCQLMRRYVAESEE